MTTHVTRRAMIRGHGSRSRAAVAGEFSGRRRCGREIGSTAGEDVFLVRSERRSFADLVPAARGIAGRPSRDARTTLVRATTSTRFLA